MTKKIIPTYIEIFHLLASRDEKLCKRVTFKQADFDLHHERILKIRRGCAKEFYAKLIANADGRLCIIKDKGETRIQVIPSLAISDFPKSLGASEFSVYVEDDEIIMKLLREGKFYFYKIRYFAGNVTEEQMQDLSLDNIDNYTIPIGYLYKRRKDERFNGEETGVQPTLQAANSY